MMSHNITHSPVIISIDHCAVFCFFIYYFLIRFNYISDPIYIDIYSTFSCPCFCSEQAARWLGIPGEARPRSPQSTQSGRLGAALAHHSTAEGRTALCPSCDPNTQVHGMVDRQPSDGCQRSATPSHVLFALFFMKRRVCNAERPLTQISQDTSHRGHVSPRVSQRHSLGYTMVKCKDELGACHTSRRWTRQPAPN